MAARERPFDPRETYLALADGPDVAAFDLTEDFWERIQSIPELNTGRMFGIFAQSADWPHWEMHPDGDELLYLLSGEIEMILEAPEDGGAERRLRLAAGQAFLVPQGAWHRAEIREPGEMLFVTRGRATQHKAR